MVPIVQEIKKLIIELEKDLQEQRRELFDRKNIPKYEELDEKYRVSDEVVVTDKGRVTHKEDWMVQESEEECKNQEKEENVEQSKVLVHEIIGENVEPNSLANDESADKVNNDESLRSNHFETKKTQDLEISAENQAGFVYNKKPDIIEEKEAEDFDESCLIDGVQGIKSDQIIEEILGENNQETPDKIIGEMQSIEVIEERSDENLQSPHEIIQEEDTEQQVLGDSSRENTNIKNSN